MTTMTLGEATDTGLAAAMAEDDRVLTWGEDVRLLRRELLARFGPDRVLDTPISEAAFLHAGVGAAMGGLRPVVEVMLADFLAVAWSGLLNAATKVPAFTAGRWEVPLVVRAACGGGYGDGGQHEQVMWGSLGTIPGLTVVVPSTPADAAGLLLSAVRDHRPVVFLEHKLLIESWRELLGGEGRPHVAFDVPDAGARGEVPVPVQPVPIGPAVLRRDGGDMALVSLGVGVHRAMTAAAQLAEEGIDAAVLDLRTVAPLDEEHLLGLATRTGHVVLVDEDDRRGGLSGEVGALLAERARGTRYARVTVDGTLPFAPDLESRALPAVDRIIATATRIVGARGPSQPPEEEAHHVR